MCRQANVPPDPHRTPLSMSDLPYEVALAMQLRVKLRSTYGSGGMAGAFYTGKDFCLLPTLFELYSVSKPYQLNVFEILHQLDQDEIEASVEALKEKAKGSGSNGGNRSISVL